MKFQSKSKSRPQKEMNNWSEERKPRETVMLDITCHEDIVALTISLSKDKQFN